MADADPGLPHVELGGYVLGTLAPRERADFERHLAGCRTCQRELERLRGLPALLDEAAEPVDVPAGLEARALGAVAREPRPGSERPTPARPVPARPRRSAAWTLGAAAALAAAFLAGLGLGSGLPVAGRPAPGPAPVAQTIRLVAADGGAASGVATVRDGPSGKIVELTVRQMPPPSAGHFYTCWLVADDDTLQHQDRVSVGSFRTSADGSATVRWETAADLARYPHLGVTLEPDNGSPLHQGPKVLTAAA
jgi:anti-sigma-K factor RskA